MLEPGYLDELWTEVVVNHPQWSRKGTRPTLNRFMSLIREGAQEMSWWHTRKHNQTIVCVQEGLLSDGKIGTYISQKQKLKEVASASGTNDRVDSAPMIDASAEEKAIRAAAQNLLVLSTLLLDDDMHCRLLKLIVHTYSPWDAWHSTQNKTLRSAGSSAPWLLGQLGGDFDAAVADMFAQSRNPQVTI